MIEFISSNFGGTIIFLVVLSILILVHEWGHFITAKKFGVRVDEFSLGFGPKLWSVKKDETEYMIKAIPLGGYVKMAGDERSKCRGKSDEFFSKPIWQRSLVVLNGPAVNVVLAYVCLVIVFLIGYPGLSTRVEYVDPSGPSAQAGLMPGDHIKSVDGKIVYGWHNLDDVIVSSRAPQIQLSVERNGQPLVFSVAPVVIDKPDLIGVKRQARDIGIDSFSTILGSVVDGFPAKAAGLQEGDRIIAVNGHPTRKWDDVQKWIKDSPTEDIQIVYVRNGLEAAVMIKAKLVPDKKDKGKFKKQLGISPRQEIEYFKVGLKDALIFSAQKIWYISVLTYRSIYHMFRGDIAAKESMTGPVGIFYMVKAAAAEGISHLLFLMGMISVSLALFNVLPILPLDGGHLLFFGIEKLRGKPLPEKVENFIMQAGIAVMLTLAVYVFYSDFSRFGFIDKIKSLFVR